MGDNSIKIVCVPSAKGSTVKEKNCFLSKLFLSLLERSLELEQFFFPFVQ